MPNEYNTDIAFNTPGLLAMAATGGHVASSEFFVTGPTQPLANEPQFLNYNYTIFGQLLTGQSIYNEILNVPTTTQNGVDIANTPVTITSASIITTNTQDAVLQISEPAGFTGNANITVTGTGTDSTTAQQSFGVNVITPAAPTAENGMLLIPSPIRSCAQNGSVQFQVTANDTAGGTATFNVGDQNPFDQPPYPAMANVTATITPGTGNTAIITLTPKAGFTGTLNLVAHATDASVGDADAQAFTLTVVGPLINAPTAVEVPVTGVVISGVSITDPSLPSTDTITLTVGHGKLKVSTSVIGGLSALDVTSNNSGTVMVTGTLAQINATLANASGLTYRPTVGYTGPDTLSISTNDQLESSNTASVALTVFGPLSINVPSGVAIPANTPQIITGLSVDDIGIPTTDNVTIKFQAADGTIALSTSVSGGLTSGQITTNGTASVTVVAPLAAINATLSDANGVTYTPKTNFNGTDTVTVTGHDTASNSDSEQMPFSIIGPLAVTLPTTLQVVGSTGPTAISGISVADPGLAGFSDLTMVFEATHGVLNFSTSVKDGLVAGELAGNGTGTVTVTAPVAAITATLADPNGLTYTPNSGFNGADSIAVTSSDVAGNSTSGSISLAVGLTVVVPPTLTLPASQASVISGMSVMDPNLPSSDTVTVTFAVNHGIVALSTTVTNGITANQVTNNGTGSVTVTATPAEINATLADASGLTYTPTNGYNGLDGIDVSATDQVESQNSGITALTIVGPLTVTAPAGPTKIAASSTQTISGVSIADPSLPTTSNVTVTFVSTVGALSLSTGVMGGITGSQITGNGTTAVSVTATVAEIDATLAAASGLGYQSVIGFDGTDTLAIHGTDTAGNLGTATTSLLVVGPMSIIAPTATQTVKINGTLNLTSISLTDPSLPMTDIVTLTINTGHGVVTLSTSITNGLTSGQISGNGTSNLTINAPLATINATLASTIGATYTPTTGFNGADTISLSAQDTHGNSKTASVAVSAVGPLTVTTPTTATLVGSSAGTAITGVSLTDSSLPTTSNVTLALSAAHGTITLSTSITNGLTAAEIAGNGTSNVTITAPLAAINATLAAASGLKYQGVSGFGGSDSITIGGSDTAGNTVNGGVGLTVVGPLAITAPTTASANENKTLAITGLSIADASLPTFDNVTAYFGSNTARSHYQPPCRMA